MGCNRNRNDVAGVSNRKRRRDDDVAGIFDNNFKVKVHAFIDGEDFCRAVRRCLINDLVAGAEDDFDGRRRDKCHRRSWI